MKKSQNGYDSFGKKQAFRGRCPGFRPSIPFEHNKAAERMVHGRGALLSAGGGRRFVKISSPTFRFGSGTAPM